ncbi:MAG: hypothetical protein Q9184_000765 [Pyrenodesmia sp. 2 TL-2023]
MASPTSFDPATIPLALPPPGVIPDFVNPYSRSWEVYLTSALLLSVTTPIVALRLYTKFLVIKQRTADDYATLVAYFAVIIYTSLTIAYETSFYGIHLWNLTLASLDNHQSIIVLVNNTVYGPVLFTVKLSLFLLIYGIFGRLQWMRHLVIFGIVVTGLVYTANVIVFPVMCSPRSGQSYVEASASPRCSRSVAFGLFSASFNIASDFYLLFLPIPAVLALQMPQKKKIGVLAIFATGLM